MSKKICSNCRREISCSCSLEYASDGRAVHAGCKPFYEKILEIKKSRLKNPDQFNGTTLQNNN